MEYQYSITIRPTNRREMHNSLQRFWTQTEVTIGVIAGTIWAYLNVALGGIDTPIKALAIFICLDFVTGVTAGYKSHTLSSRVGAKGIWKKIGIFICIMLAYLLDIATQMNMFRGMVISGFSVIEAMSLIENIDRMGYGYIIPNFLRTRLEQIADEKHLKGEDKK